MAQNFYRLVTLLVDIGAKVLRRYLQHHGGYTTLPQLLSGAKHQLYHNWYPRENGNCCCRGTIRSTRSNITRDQFELLFDKEIVTPPCSYANPHHCWFKAKPVITFEILDVTLARILIVNVIETLSARDSAALEKIRELRNFLAHIPGTSINDQEFELKWRAARVELIHIADTVPRPFVMDVTNEIKELETRSLDESKCNELLGVVRLLTENTRLLEEISAIIDVRSTVVTNFETSETIQSDVHDVKSDVQTVRGEVKDVKSDVQTVRGEVKDVKSDVQTVRGEVKDVTSVVQGVQSEIKDVRNEFKSGVQGVQSEIKDVRNEVKSDVRDVQTEVLNVKSEVKGVRSVVQELQTGLKRMEQNTQTILKTHHKNLYVSSSRAEKAAYKGLCKDHFITIIGRGGQGKTTLGKHLMQKVCNERLAGKDTLTPVILDKADDFDLIQSKDRLVLFIDDPFGKSNINKTRLEDWERQFEKIVSFVSEGNIYIIMAIRSSILNECSDKLKYDLFKEEQRVDLTSHLYRMTQQEKYVMLESYCDKHNVSICRQEQNVLSNPASHSPVGSVVKASSSTTMNTQIDHLMLYEISISDPYLGFPQSCYSFFTNKKFFDKGLDFFKHPSDSIQRDIYSMKKSDPLQYIVLVYMMLEGGKIDLNELNEVKLEELCENTHMQSVNVENIKECVRFGVNGVYIQKLEESTESQDLIFRLTHQCILESVLLSFCKSYPGVFLELGQDGQIDEFARPAEYKRMHGEVCVNLPARCHKQLAERFLHKHSGDSILVLVRILVNRRFYTDISFVMDVFNLKDAYHGCITKLHGDLEYVLFHIMITGARKDDKNLLIFFKTLCKHFAIYKQTTSGNFATGQQSLVKLQLPVATFIDVLNYVIESGDIQGVEELLDLSELDLHARYDRKYDSEDYLGEHRCAINQRSTDLQSHFEFVLNLNRIWSLSFENPVCFSCIRGYKNLTAKLLDRMNIVNLNEIIERLMHILVERDWSDVLQRLIDKHGNMLQYIRMSKLILHAAQCKTKGCVLYLLKLNVDLNLTDTKCHTVLHYCCENDWVDIFDNIVKKNKDIIVKVGLSPSTLILHAASHDSKQMVSHLLQYDFDLTVRDEADKTLLHYCCKEDWVDIFEMILKKDKHVLEKDGLSPSVLILHAASHDSKQMVSHLLQYDVDFTVRDEAGKTLLHYCCERGWVDIFDRILKKDAHVLEKDGLSLSLPILHAARHDRRYMVSHLLQYDVDFTLRDEVDKTLLHYCCKEDWVDIFERILKKDTHVLERNGLSPSLLILHAASHGSKQMVSHLLQYDIDFTVRDKADNTLLHHCYKKDWVDIFEMILKKDKHVLERNGLPPSLLILYAASHYSKQMVSHLLQYDVDFTVRDEAGKTLLHYCCERGWVDIFDRILKKDKHVLERNGLPPSLLILYAASHYSKQMVSHLLQNDIDFTVRDEVDKTLLHYCCKEDWVDIFERIFKKDKHVLEKDGLSSSLLILHAASHGSKQMVSHLLQYDIDFTVRDKADNTLLHHCYKRDWVDIFEMILKKDKHVLERNGLPPSLLILYAASHYSKQMVSHLLQNDIDFTVRDEGDKTLLHYCCKWAWVDIFDRIFKKDKHVLEKDGLSSSLLILHTARFYSNYGKQMVSHLLQYDVDFTVRDEKNETLLHYCCIKNWVDIFDRIIKKDTHMLEKDGLSPSLLILHAASHDSKHMVSHLLQYDVDFTVRDEADKTLLHYCCIKNWVDIFDRILKKDTHVLEKDGLSPSLLILHAASHDSKHMVSYLLQYDVDFTVRDEADKTLLHYCCIKNWVDIFDRILKKDTHVLEKDGLSPSLLILHAASLGSKQMVSLLFQYDVDFTVRDRDGKTLLHYCCEEDWVDIFEMISKRDKHVLDKDGLPPSLLILYAASHYSKQMVSHLLQNDIDFTVRDEVDKTLLHYCCKEDWVDIFERIFKKDKHVLEKDGLSSSLLILHAASHGSKQMVSHLLQYDIDFTVRDKADNTLLHHCYKRDWVDIFEMILKKDKHVLERNGLPPSLLILYAASHYSKQMVSHLLQNDIDFTVRDEGDKTLLHYCCKWAWVDIFDRIFKKDKHVLEKDGLSSSLLILHTARFYSNYGKQMVSHLLQYDVDFTVRDEKNETLLHYCCIKNWVDIFARIIKKDTHMLEKDGLSPSLLILHAASHDSKHMVSHLLQYDVDFTVRDEADKTLLHYCCIKNWVDIFDRILKKDTHVLEKDGLSPSLLILHAASHDSKHMVSHLLQYDVDFTVRDEADKTLLHYCCIKNWVDIFDRILKKDTHVLEKDGLSPSLLILHAASLGSKQMVSLLFQYDVDFTVRDRDGKTLLHYCCEEDWVDIFEMISKRDKHVLDKDGLSPSLLILHAARHDSEKMVSHLLKCDVDFTLSDDMGNSLLHYFCYFGWEELVCSIVNSNQGVINLKNGNGRPPIFCATQNNRKKTVILLLKYGADVLLHDNAGNTLLHYCVKCGWLDIIQQHLTDTNVVNCRNNADISPLHTAFIYIQSNVVEELCKSDEIPQEEINTCSKIICLGMLIDVFWSKNRHVFLPNIPDYLDNMLKHKYDLDSPIHPEIGFRLDYQISRYKEKANIDHFYCQFLKYNKEYSVGFFEPLRSDDHGYTVIHLLVMGASSIYGYSVCDLLDFFIDNYGQSVHVRNTTLLPTALHIAAYLGSKTVFIRLYEAGVRCSDGDLSIVETVKRGKLLCSHIGFGENIWSHSTDLCLLMKSSFFDNVFFSVEEDFNSILDFCERN